MGAKHLKVALVVLDGAGLAPADRGNAITEDTLPTLFAAMRRHGFATLKASGSAVGLEQGQVGNSEAGHLILGLGRNEPSALSRINDAFLDGSWAAHPLWHDLAGCERLHVVGLLSDAGVHAHWRSLWQIAALAARHGCGDIVVHPFLDGVDSPAGTAPDLMAALETALAELNGKISLGVVMGRHWFTDRSGKTELTRRFADAVCGRQNLPAFTHTCLAEHLARDREATFPAHLVPGGVTIGGDDRVILSSHRADRAEQAARLLEESSQVYALVSLGDAVPAARVFYPTVPIGDGLAFELKKYRIYPLRIAEASKFPHVTFFMNGFNKSLGESQICVPARDESPEELPEMALPAVTEVLLEGLSRTDHRVIIANFANLDQVGHSGRIDRVRVAARHVERTLKRILPVCRRQGWSLLLTGDHGNAERMLDDRGRPLGAHSSNPVPLIVIPAEGVEFEWLDCEGSLANVAPSLLALLGLEPGPGMTEPLVRLRSPVKAALP